MEDLCRGRIQVEAGRTTTGLRRMLVALEALRGTGTLYGWSQRTACLVAAYLSAGNIQEGLNALADAFALVEKTGERFYLAELHRLKGDLLLRQGAEAEAEASLHEAIAVALRQRARSWELRATTSLARLWQKQGKRREAREMLAQVYDWFTEGFDTRDLQEAKALLDELA